MADDTLPPPDGYHLTRTYGAHEWVTPDEYPTVYRDNAREVRPVMYADTVRRLLAEARAQERDRVVEAFAERDRHIARLELLLSNCVESLAGYRREHGHEQACDAEAAARKELEARNGR